MLVLGGGDAYLGTTYQFEKELLEHATFPGPLHLLMCVLFAADKIISPRKEEGGARERGGRSEATSRMKGRASSRIRSEETNREEGGRRELGDGEGHEEGRGGRESGSWAA